MIGETRNWIRVAVGIHVISLDFVPDPENDPTSDCTENAQVLLSFSCGNIKLLSIKQTSVNSHCEREKLYVKI
jgi:hypothetical protein